MTDSPRTRCTSRTCSNSSPDLAWRNHTRSPIRSSAAGWPVSGVWTSPAPSSPVRCRPGGAHGTGERSVAGGAARDEAAAVDGRHRRRGLARHPQAEERRRARLEGRVVVEDARAPAGPTRRRSRSPRGRRRWPRPTRSRRRSRTRARSTSRQRLGDLAAAHLELRHRRLLEPAYEQGPGALVGHVVLDAGDLALVGHHADEPEAVALDDAAGQRDDVGGVEERRALGADVLAAEPQPGVEVERDPDRRRRASRADARRPRRGGRGRRPSA